MMGIRPLIFLMIILLVPSLASNIQASDITESSYSDQTKPETIITPNLYTSKFPALNVKEQMTLSPLFTPDNAIDLYAGWLSSANTTIEVQNQYITQWDDSVLWVNDPSPIVRELVNAKNRGVTVRVQVRDDADSDDVTNYLLSEGIEVRWMGNQNTDDGDGYLSATHNKMILIDDKVSIISSINFGKSAFTTNREAGMIIRSSTVTNYYKSIFESDWIDGEVPPAVLQVSN
ncbi:MAG: phospholipase D-like domain-containing protein, partial [Candidatus Heimdallarchaeota archaeon]